MPRGRKRWRQKRCHSLWLRHLRPALFAKNNIYVGAGEFLFFKLTGAWRQDPGNALQIGCYNARRQRLDPALLAIARAPLSFVAPLRSGHERHPLAASGAELLSLPAGIPVVGPYMDQEAGYLAVTPVSRRPLQCSLGTAWVGNFILNCHEQWRDPFQLTIPSPQGRGYLVMQPLLTGNVDLLRAVAASMVCEMHRALAALKRRRKVDAVVLTGGASKGWCFQTLFAALFAPLPVYVLAENDAAVCRGAVSVFSRAVNNAGVERVSAPAAKERRRIAEYYARYLAVFSRLYKPEKT
ncbi:MAG: FGGY family carbohydrate kinase [Planctomycetota bacterium]|nr:FGGY family carbohydrate kinase [Planctomycetota bacterium]